MRFRLRLLGLAFILLNLPGSSAQAGSTVICIHPVQRAVKQLVLRSQQEEAKEQEFLDSAEYLMSKYCSTTEEALRSTQQSDMGNGCVLRSGEFHGEIVYWAACDNARDLDEPGPAYTDDAPSWRHNGSEIVLKQIGRSVILRYSRPKQALQEAGVFPGAVLFTGSSNNGSLHGTAYRFSRACGRLGYSVSGQWSPQSMVLRGNAPNIGSDCRVTGYRSDTLTFDIEYHE